MLHNELKLADNEYADMVDIAKKIDRIKTLKKENPELDINELDADGNTLLHIAASYVGHMGGKNEEKFQNQVIDYIDALLKAGVDPYKVNTKGEKFFDLLFFYTYPPEGNYCGGLKGKAINLITIPSVMPKLIHILVANNASKLVPDLIKKISEKFPKVGYSVPPFILFASLITSGLPELKLPYNTDQELVLRLLLWLNDIYTHLRTISSRSSSLPFLQKHIQNLNDLIINADTLFSEGREIFRELTKINGLDNHSKTIIFRAMALNPTECQFFNLIDHLTECLVSKNYISYIYNHLELELNKLVKGYESYVEDNEPQPLSSAELKLAKQYYDSLENAVTGQEYRANQGIHRHDAEKRYKESDKSQSAKVIAELNTLSTAIINHSFLGKSGLLAKTKMKEKCIKAAEMRMNKI